MADRLTPGIFVREIPGRETALDAFPTGVAAFIGSMPRGPVNEAVTVDDPDAFERLFGVPGTEFPLQQCVSDYFHSGGRRAVVVRVVNGATPCTLRLPCAEGALTLEALSPGGREWLRASIDYDNLDPGDVASFNLVIQRLRAPRTERVADQEIYPRVTVKRGADRYVADVLLDSRLVRVRGMVPALRPGPTVSSAPGNAVTWLYAAADGRDGEPLSDYDRVGSSMEGTGLFALDRVARLDLLCLPPGPDGRGPGATLLLAALRYCRRRRTLLLLEPPDSVADTDAALAWVRGLAIAGANVAAVYPALIDSAASGVRPASGAVAGALLRAAAGGAPMLGFGVRPRGETSAQDRRRLVAAGVNVLVRGTGGRVMLEGDRTLATAECRVPPWRSLSARCLSLSVEETLLEGTRWVVFEPHASECVARLAEQLSLWLESLRFAGKLAGGPGEAWFVHIDPPRIGGVRPECATFTVGFAPRRAGEFVIYRVSQSLHAARLAPVSTERWAMGRADREARPALPCVAAEAEQEREAG